MWLLSYFTVSKQKKKISSNHLKANKAVGETVELWSVSLYLISLNLAA